MLLSFIINEPTIHLVERLRGQGSDKVVVEEVAVKLASKVSGDKLLASLREEPRNKNAFKATVKAILKKRDSLFKIIDFFIEDYTNNDLGKIEDIFSTGYRMHFYKLPKKVIDKQIENFKKEGMEVGYIHNFKGVTFNNIVNLYLDIDKYILFTLKESIRKHRMQSQVNNILSLLSKKQYVDKKALLREALEEEQKLSYGGKYGFKPGELQSSLDIIRSMTEYTSSKLPEILNYCHVFQGGLSAINNIIQELFLINSIGDDKAEELLAIQSIILKARLIRFIINNKNKFFKKGSYFDQNKAYLKKGDSDIDFNDKERAELPKKNFDNMTRLYNLYIDNTRTQLLDSYEYDSQEKSPEDESHQLDPVDDKEEKAGKIERIGDYRYQKINPTIIVLDFSYYVLG